MRVGSLFTGVGGFDLGAEQAGCEIAWQVEADHQCRSVLKHRFPNVPIYEDVKNVGRSNLDDVDIICGGFPCQDLSVAGGRKGIRGSRSGLWFSFHRILSELSAEWVCIENVPGLLSSNGGGDFALLLRGLGDIGYSRIAWRVFDSRFTGVPQRRRRVYILACRGTGTGSPGKILAIPESLSGNPPSSETERCESTGSSDESTRREGSRKYGVEVLGDDVANTVNARYYKGPSAGRDGLAGNIVGVRSYYDLAPTLTADAAGTSRVGGKGAEPHFYVGAKKAYHDVAPTLFASGAGTATTASAGSEAQFVVGVIPRRLTPRECERLQGFPDDWTLYGDGKELADSPRYRMMGNAVTVPVSEFIFTRLVDSYEKHTK